MHKPHVAGAVYGVILNDAASLQALGALDAPPYKGAPKAPALYIKPSNTLVNDGAVVCLPDGARSVEVAATIGIVIGTSVARLTPANALRAVCGLVLCADLSLPHASYYRPAIREKCFDGALPVSGVHPLRDVSALELTTEIDGELAARWNLSDLLRTPAQLLADVTEFMTLSEGDVLLVGVRFQAPQAKAGSKVRISAAGLGQLSFSIAATPQGEMQ
jgi:5-oxopent-3-ene-1,2,5-tricarboxylate decarboxylase/2-hydroxyhepta-2,4-diene-1,7-dioate isomerase